ncbi:MAG: 2-succinyl-5-enolpyruvyl-6-hydroxy-3-cyclohexene-1-carboxylic-acid synthase [Candidatus Nanopelagicales bacterium]
MNPSTACARVLVDELVRGGVRDVVLAPGSRSAPLAIALAEAEARDELHLHVRVDERSAGFLALGLARVNLGLPVAVMTTSGTAVANLHPAVTEASYAGVPLVVVSADRPPRLRGTGANQTVDQVKVFGDDVRWFADLAVPVREPGQVRYWRSVVSRACAVAADMMDPGPVHLNVPFDEPLVPDGDDDWVEPLAGRDDAWGEPRPWTVDARLAVGMSIPIEQAVSHGLGRTAIPGRGLIVVGDHADPDAPELVDELSDALGWPVLSEPSGNCRDMDLALVHGPLLLADPEFADAHVPDLVLTVGRVGLSRSVLRMVARAPLHVAVDSRPPSRTADPTRTADLVLAAVPLPPEADVDVDPEWLQEWHAADTAAATAVDSVLHEAARKGLTGAEVARTVAAAIPADGLLLVGSSWPVRLVEAYAPVVEAKVLGNRGASGIDGLVSTAWGAAARHQRPGPSWRDRLGDDGVAELPAGIDPDAPRAGGIAVALLGDLAFLHDRNGLLAPADEERPDLIVIVIDNDGGGIFSSLEQGEPQHAAVFERVFGTPHGRDLVAMARADGVPATRARGRRALVEALERAAAAGGVHVVVADVGERAAEADLLRRLQEAVSRALR